jgi:hypothetical protein
MRDEFTYNLKRLLTLFQEVWSECNALRITRKVEWVTGGTANRETILQASQKRAQELFQPALSDLDNGAPLTLVLEKLLERLEGSRK